MGFPVEIVFRHLDPSTFVEAFVREKATRLGHFGQQIQNCRVVIDKPHHHQVKGNGYRVHVELLFSGYTVVATHRAGCSRSQDDIYTAINDGLNKAEARLHTLIAKTAGHHMAQTRKYRQQARRINLLLEPEEEDSRAEESAGPCSAV